MIKLLGMQIVFGYSPEARVFATLLAHRVQGLDALVLHHDWPGDRRSAERFEANSLAKVVRLEVGWRPNFDGQRWRLAKAASWLRFLIVLPRMLKVARAYGPDVIYSSQQRWDCLAATYIARHLNKPQIIHLHYTVGPWLHGHPLRRLLTCDHVVAVSDFIRDEALRHGVPPERVTTIRNPISPFPPSLPGTREMVRAELGLPADAPLIGIVARLDSYKGQTDTIAAFAKIAAAYPAAHLLIVGDGTTRQALEAQAAQTGLRERILFTGRRSDVPRILAALDIFAHPSRFDPCPLALLEASGAGLPVLAYAEGGGCEIVVDGETGLLAPAGDIDALATYLAKLLDEPGMARRIGAAGRRRMAADFRPEDAGQAFTTLLERIVNGQEATPATKASIITR